MITADELRRVKIFSTLEESELVRLAQKAADVRLAPDEWLIREGELPWFFVLLEGRLRVVKDILGRQQELREFHYEHGDFFGEVPILLGSASLISVRAETPSRAARFDRQQFQDLIRDSKEASAMILQTMNERITRAQNFASTVPSYRVLIVGTQYDTDCREIRGFLSNNRMPFEWVDREHEPERIPPCVSKDILGPAVVIDGHHCLHPPTVRGVAEALQIQTRPNRDKYDVVIVGAGPAGMAAGVYGASEGLTVLMVERSAAGGQAGTSSRIENYLGFPEGVSGDELTGRALKQAVRFGAEIAMTRSIESIAETDGGYSLKLDGGESVSARAVLLAMGVDWRRLEVKGADRLLGRGVLYGASRTEACDINGKKVFLVGGGNSAGQAAVFFSNYAAEINMLVRGAGLKLSMSQYLIGEIASKANIQVIPFTQVIAAEGNDHLERIVTSTRPKDEPEILRTHEADALFVMIGADACTNWLPQNLQRDGRGYVLTGRHLTSWRLDREPFPLETSLPGIFCAGDVRHDSIKRVSSGVGEGSMSIAFIHQYLEL